MNKKDFSNFITKPDISSIIGMEKYSRFAVLVPFVYINNEYHIVFEKRAAGIPQGGEISFPGGRIEPNIDSGSSDAAKRETVEELGINADNICIYKPFGTLIAAMGRAIDVFIGELKIQSLDELQPDINEVERLYTIPVSFFMSAEPEEYSIHIEAHSSYVDKEGKDVVLFPAKELGLPDRYTGSWGMKQKGLYVYHWEDCVIWGITADILHALVGQIKEDKTD